MIRWSNQIGLREDDETTYHYAIGCDDETGEVWSYDISWFQWPDGDMTRAFITVYQLVGTCVEERCTVELETEPGEESDAFHARFEAKLDDVKQNTYAYLATEVL